MHDGKKNITGNPAEQKTLREKVNQVMTLLMNRQTAEIDDLAGRYPAFETLLQKLRQKGIIYIENGKVIPLKTKILNAWSKLNTPEKYNSFLELMEKSVEKKKTVFKNKKELKWILSIAIIAMISFLMKWGLNRLFGDEVAKEIPQLTVFVTDTNGNVVLEHAGEVNTSLGNRPLRETIGEDGRVNFDDLQKSYLGDTLQLGFKAEGWELVHPDTLYVFTGAPIRLYIQRNLGVIKGTVRSRESGEYLAGAAIRINTDTIIYTDVDGIFNTKLPPKFQVPSVHQRYKLEVSAPGYESKSEYYQPLSTPADIRLKKKK